MRQNKFAYLKVIQQHTGPQYGWEDVDAHETDSTGYIKDKAARDTFKYNLKAYRSEQPYPVRVVFRRELIS
jgi:hypothetical protein